MLLLRGSSDAMANGHASSACATSRDGAAAALKSVGGAQGGGAHATGNKKRVQISMPACVSMAAGAGGGTNSGAGGGGGGAMAGAGGGAAVAQGAAASAVRGGGGQAVGAAIEKAAAVAVRPPASVA